MAKGNLLKKVLTYGMFSCLALSSFFPMKAFGETLYDRKHNVKMYINNANVNYGSSGPPLTPLEIRVDRERAENKIEISIFTEKWSEKKDAERMAEYIELVNGRTNITLAYPKCLEIRKVEQEAYEIYRTSWKDKKMSGGWVELAPVEKCPRLKFMAKGSRYAGQSAISVVPALAAGSSLVAIPAYILAKIATDMADNIIEYRMENERIGREEALKKVAETYEVGSIPIHPAEKLATMRNFKIYLQRNGNGEFKTDKALIMLNVGLRRGASMTEEVGSLENLMIEVPLR